SFIMSLRIAALLVTLASTSLVSADPYPITGVKADKGSLPVRRNVDDLEAEKGPQWDLYVQSLSSMYQMNPDDSLSFFQIAGIHGWPYVEWNNTGKGIDSGGWAGYCPHGEPIFLPWHRAYVLLFEQSLVEKAKQIASQYPQSERNTYAEAANSLRAPYWDWATSNKVPDASLPAKVTIKTAKGEQEVANPLASYKFPDAAMEGRYGDIAGAEASQRARDQIQRCPSPRSYPDSANGEMSLQNNNRRRQDYGDMVYDAFTTSRSFAEFASTRSQGTSLEQIHNFIHVEATCASDFLNSRVSGFDPLFMLHHSNIDRLWSYWQAIHPKDVIFTESYQGGARFTTPRGSTISPNTPLAPFFGPNGKPHTSNTVLSIQDFGYSYEGLEYGSKSAEEIKRSAARMIRKLYGKGKAPTEDEGSENEIPDTPPSKNGTAPDTPPSKNGTAPTEDKPSDDEPSEEDEDSDNEIPDTKPSKNGTSTGKPPSKTKPTPGKGPFSNSTRPELTRPDLTRPDLTRPETGRPSKNSTSGKPPKTGKQPGNDTQPDKGDKESTKPSDIDSSNRRYAQVKINVEEVERPCYVSIFIANVYAGSMIVMPEPSTGIVNGAIFLNTAIEQFGSSGNGSSKSFEDSIGCEITKTDGTVIALKKVPSLKIEIDQVTLTPPKDEDDLSVPSERKAEPVSKFSPPPPGSAGSAGGPSLPPVEISSGGRGGQGGQGGRSDQPEYGDGNQGGGKDGKPKPKPKEKPGVTSAAGKLSPLPVLLVASVLLLI
ncbi:hypothetical protein CP533_0124, partial [Ophiocordyceps camponoti-saundersi (nom. inval.)]